jgi:hypothetical protein
MATERSRGFDNRPLRRRLYADAVSLYGSLPVIVLAAAVAIVVALIVASVFSGLIAAVIEVGLVLVLVVVRYYWRGDPTWKIDFGGSIAPAETLTFFELVSASEAPVDPRTLGAVQCVIRTPAGRVWESDVGEHSLRINPMGIIARFPIDPDPGTYHVRWNAGHHVGALQKSPGPRSSSGIPMRETP